MSMPKAKNKRRLLGLLLVLVSLLAVLIVRTGYWSLVEGSRLEDQGEIQWTKDIVVDAARGSILDVNGNLLATSSAANTVVVRPGEVEDADQVADTLSRILRMDRDQIYEKATDTTKYEKWIKRQITRDQTNAIEKAELPGVAFIDDIKRYYPNNELAAQVIGMTSLDGVGISGAERQYNKYLAGKNGRTIAETDKNGVELINGNELNIESTDGYDVSLTVDSVIQSYLEQSCTEAYNSSGAVSVQGIVFDPKTADVLAIANIKGFDLNDPPTDSDEMNEKMRNRVISEPFEPHSLFRIITLASALDSGVATIDGSFNCNGYDTVANETIICKDGTKHGDVPVFDSITSDCNSVFLKMGVGMGRDTVYKYLKGFGFGSRSGIDSPNESEGYLPEEKYVSDVEIAKLSYGEYIKATPLQMVNAMSALVNGGHRFRPHVVSKVTDKDGNAVYTKTVEEMGTPVTPETSEKVISILQSIADKQAAANETVRGYNTGGLSDVSVQPADEMGNALAVSSYIGFAPVDDPDYIIAILLEKEISIDESDSIESPTTYANKVLSQILTYKNIPADYFITDDEVEDVTDEAVQVPDVRGKDMEEARDILHELGLQTDVYGKDEVSSQFPEGGTDVKPGTTIQLYGADYDNPEATLDPLEANENLVIVPDVTGLNILEAKEKIEAAGFEFVAYSSGTAARQVPSANSYAEAGSKVSVYFSLGL